MLFHSSSRLKKSVLVLSCLASFACVTPSLYAAKVSTPSTHLTEQQIQALLNKADESNQLHVVVTPEVVAEVNQILNNEEQKFIITSSLKRMKQYQPVIDAELKKQSMPTDLVALPLVQSGYQPLDASENPVAAAGIWQMIPQTATKLGLVVTDKQDDRLNTELSTKAAIAYLNSLHTQLHDWDLALVAYEIGEKKTTDLMNKYKSRNVWELARATSASKDPVSKDLNKYLAMLSATVIIMHNPSLVE
jgi:membrane-bound lytic murein transglycosylase D